MGMETVSSKTNLILYERRAQSSASESPTVNLNHMLNQLLLECEGEMRERQEKAHF